MSYAQTFTYHAILIRVQVANLLIVKSQVPLNGFLRAMYTINFPKIFVFASTFFSSRHLSVYDLLVNVSTRNLE